MSFLDGLFTRSADIELSIAADPITADAYLTPGVLYLIEGSDDPITLTINGTALGAAGKRLGIKVAAAAPTPPGGVLEVVAPGGMLIEADDGSRASTVALTQSIGNYREWLCDADGVWILVAGAPSASDGGGGVPPASTYESGGAEEIDVTELLGVLANAQRFELAKAAVLVGSRKRINLIEGGGVTITAADDPGNDRFNVTLTAVATADAAALFAWASNAASINVSSGHNHAASNTLTGNSTLTLTNGVDGSHGLIFVKQDATGARTLAFTIAGRTVLKDLNVPDTNPLATASAITVYQYYYVTIASVAYVVLNKVYLQ